MLSICCFKHSPSGNLLSLIAIILSIIFIIFSFQLLPHGFIPPPQLLPLLASLWLTIYLFLHLIKYYSWYVSIYYQHDQHFLFYNLKEIIYWFGKGFFYILVFHFPSSEFWYIWLFYNFLKFQNKVTDKKAVLGDTFLNGDNFDVFD